MDQKHTPGPWVVEETFSVRTRNPSALDPKYREYIATCHVLMKLGDRQGEMQANAQLIAAAPDLLEAANLALSALTDEVPPAKAIDAPVFALRKAQGE